VVGFYLPPLRDREGHLIEALTRHFVAEFAAHHRQAVEEIAPTAMQALCDYSWPGNIRELRNVIERAIALCSGKVVHLVDLPPAIRPTPSSDRTSPNGRAEATVHSAGSSLARTKEDAEAAHIVQTLRKNQNNRLRAAAELGVSRMTLYKKMHRYGLMGLV
jgi:DNA-binding NtrC family response regulator